MSNIVYTIISAADGEMTGKVRLQKVAYVLDLAGLTEPLAHRYYHFGPYSDIVTNQATEALSCGLLTVNEVQTEWGGAYTAFKAHEVAPVDDMVSAIVKKSCSVESVVLELAATAAYLKQEFGDAAWDETARRKPLKATSERLAKAKAFWSDLRTIHTPKELPAV